MGKCIELDFTSRYSDSSLLFTVRVCCELLTTTEDLGGYGSCGGCELIETSFCLFSIMFSMISWEVVYLFFYYDDTSFPALVSSNEQN